MRYPGRCHCGNLSVAFETAKDPAKIPLRLCLCTFCRRHGSVAVTDPEGGLEVSWADPSQVSRYRFGLRTSDFLVCRTCGVYVAALCEVDGRLYATLNANALDARAVFTQTPTEVDYDAEGVPERMARRRRVWTPAVVASAR
jgi:hypothetical protein